jgi:hypothetical protein
MALISKGFKKFLIALVAVPVVLTLGAFAVAGVVEYSRVYPVLSALDAPSSVEIFAITPKDTANREADKLHGVTVLGHAMLHDELAAKATGAYKRALASHSLFMQVATGCVYTPAYALRVVSGVDTYDFLLSDSCDHLDVFRGDKKVLSINDASGKPQEFNDLLLAVKFPAGR